jgi:hypothetical protein
MRIDELKIDDARHLTRTPWDQKEAAEKWLKDHGFKRIGEESSYGSVWTDHVKSIVKIFSNDPCYLRFIDFCRKHRGNPYIPRLSKLYPIGQNGGVVFSEMLSPINYRYDIIIGQIDDYFTLYLNDGKYVPDYLGIPPWKAEFEEQYPLLADIIRKLAREFKNGPCRNDLHNGNFMLRGDTPVIIDPVAPKNRAIP